MKPKLHRNVAGAGVAHSQRNGEWVDAMPSMVEEFPIANLVCESATHARTGDDRCPLAQLLGPFDSGRSNGLASSNDGKLRKAVHEAECFSREMLLRVIPKHRS